MGKEFLIQTLSGKINTEASIVFMMYFLCWFIDFYLGTFFLKTKGTIIKISLSALGMAVYSFFIKPLLPAETCIFMFIPMALLLMFITGRNIFKSLLASLALLVLIFLTDMVIAGPLYMSLGKTNYSYVLDFRYGFFGLIINSIIEIITPLLVLIAYKKDKPFSIFTKLETVNYRIGLILGAVYFVIFNMLLNFLIDLQSGRSINKASVLQLLAAFIVIFGVYISHTEERKRISKQRERYESQITDLEAENKRLLRHYEELKTTCQNPEDAKKIDDARQHFLLGLHLLSEVEAGRQEERPAKKEKLTLLKQNPV
jgi:hypothetical protein